MKKSLSIVTIFLVVIYANAAKSIEQDLFIDWRYGSFEGDKCKTTVESLKFWHRCTSKVHWVPGGKFPIYEGNFTVSEQENIIELIEEANFFELPENSYGETKNKKGGFSLQITYQGKSHMVLFDGSSKPLNKIMQYINDTIRKHQPNKAL